MMDLKAALAILAQVIKDRKQWGQNAGLRISQDELINSLLAVEDKLFGDYVPRDELTLSNRRYAALNAQHEKLKKAQ